MLISELISRAGAMEFIFDIDDKFNSSAINIYPFINEFVKVPFL